MYYSPSVRILSVANTLTAWSVSHVVPLKNFVMMCTFFLNWNEPSSFSVEHLLKTLVENVVVFFWFSVIQEKKTSTWLRVQDTFWWKNEQTRLKCSTCLRWKLSILCWSHSCQELLVDVVTLSVSRVENGCPFTLMNFVHPVGTLLPSSNSSIVPLVSFLMETPLRKMNPCQQWRWQWSSFVIVYKRLLVGLIAKRNQLNGQLIGLSCFWIYYLMTIKLKRVSKEKQ